MHYPDGQSQYRPEIDGLRAIAVLGVVLYHYNLGALAAGFAGVDVFFVISGFLIGGIILDQRAAGTFRFKTFYLRRLRRIIPALLVMMLLTIPVAALLMSPHDLRYFGGGALAALLFVSNLWFFNRIDYFDPAASRDPLLHTWSLGVEEQFYFFIPLILVVIGVRRPRVTWAAVGLIFVASLIWMLKDHRTYHAAVFYMIHYRAWELAAGVLTAMALRANPAAARGTVSTVLSTAGLALVVGSLFFTPRDAFWPGPWTLLPIVGTVLLLGFPTPDSPAFRILTWKPIVWIGLLSYSLYLYHQPLHSLAEIGLGNESLSVVIRAGLFVLALVLAGLSWHFVEQPFRHGALSKRSGALVLGGMTVVLLSFAIGGHVTEGYPKRLPVDARAAIRFEQSEPPTYRQCARGMIDGVRFGTPEACIHGAEARPATVAIWGDSHAASIAQPLGEALVRHGLAIHEYTLGGCPPISGVISIYQLTNTADRNDKKCAEYVANLLDFMRADRDIRVVVLYAYWNNYTERRDFDAGNGRIKTDNLYALPVGASIGMTEQDRLAALAEGLETVIQTLLEAGKVVLIIDPLPEPAFDVPQTYAWALWKGQVSEADVSVPRAAFDNYSILMRRILDNLPAHPALFRQNLSESFCDAAGRCELVAENGDVLFRDLNHLSLAGSARVVDKIADKIAAIMEVGADATR
ncbi:MAG: acyltransferase family protein [Paracoccaceae bacterium]